jgi:hypothetical protein
MATVTVPVEAGNRGMQDGSLPKLLKQTAERWGPEAMYFGSFGGVRTALIVFDLPESSGLPTFGEPFFMEFNAKVEVTPVMNADDLQKGMSDLI